MIFIDLFGWEKNKWPKIQLLWNLKNFKNKNSYNEVADTVKAFWAHWKIDFNPVLCLLTDLVVSIIKSVWDDK